MLGRWWAAHCPGCRFIHLLCQHKAKLQGVCSAQNSLDIWNLLKLQCMTDFETKGAFHLPELAGQTDQSVNQMRCVILKGWCCKILENNHFENGLRYLEEIRRRSIKLILQIGRFGLRTDWSGQPVLTNGNRLKMYNSNNVIHQHKQITLIEKLWGPAGSFWAVRGGRKEEGNIEIKKRKR